MRMDPGSDLLFKELLGMDFNLLQLTHIFRDLFDFLGDKGSVDGADFTISYMRTKETFLFGSLVAVAVEVGVMRRDFRKGLSLIPDEIIQTAEKIFFKLRGLFFPPEIFRKEGTPPDVAVRCDSQPVFSGSTAKYSMTKVICEVE